MGEIIEHGDNENPISVRIGESNSIVPIKVYQDIYHQVTGRTEQIRKRYSQNLLIELSEIEQLHHKIMQLCDVHRIIAKNEVVSVFHEKERKEQFTSFDRFKSYNSNSPIPTAIVVLKYNFSIIPAGLDKPQEYIITIRLISRVAMLQQLESDAPPFVRGRLFGLMAGDTAEISVEYADYVIARGFLEAFDEWVNGCKTEPDVAWIKFIQRWSHHIPQNIKMFFAFLTSVFALHAIPEFFLAPTAPEVWARFLIYFGAGFYLIVNLAGTAGRTIEDAIDSYAIISYVSLNKGDIKLIKKFSDRKNGVRLKFILGCLLTLVIGVASSLIASAI